MQHRHRVGSVKGIGSPDVEPSETTTFSPSATGAHNTDRFAAFFGSGSLRRECCAQSFAERWWTMWLEIDLVVSHPKVLGQQPQPLH